MLAGVALPASKAPSWKIGMLFKRSRDRLEPTRLEHQCAQLVIMVEAQGCHPTDNFL